jgi:hypothetical protein
VTGTGFGVQKFATTEANAAVEFAEQSVYPTFEESMQDIYRNPTTTGRHFFNQK